MATDLRAGEIELATARGNHIPNLQVGDLHANIAHALEELVAKHSAERRRGPTVQYNCFGHVFACSRTGIDDPQLVQRILEEDEYEVIPEDKALPGDVVLYHGEKGEIEHAAILVAVVYTDRGIVSSRRVVSKWANGPEVLHDVYKCDYSRTGIKYYRLRDNLSLRPAGVV